MGDRIPEWLQHHYKTYYEKGGHCRRQALIVGKKCTTETCFPDE